MIQQQTKFNLSDQTHIGEVRRHCAKLAIEMEFNETLTGQIAIVVTELATNILTHAISGEMIFSISSISLDILALDSGPGISNIAESLKDGYSTSGTAGNGLGAIKRLSHFFEIFTQPKKGTVVYVSFKKDKAEKSDDSIAGISLPIKGEVVCGDAWDYIKKENNFKIIVVDGLGHGLYAFEASELAKKIFRQEVSRSHTEIMSLLHNSLRSTRGAAVSIAEIENQSKILNYCGIGNIAAALITKDTIKHPISYNGTIGAQIKKIQSFPYPINKDAILVMYSDGLKSSWSLNDYPGILFMHPFMIASILYRDFNRHTDDVTVVVAKVDQ